LARTSTDEGVRWNTYSAAQVRGQVRHALHRGGAGADQRHALVGQPVQRRAKRVAAGVGIVPAAGVEGMSLEGVDAGDARQLGHMQRAGAQADEVGGEVVAAVGLDRASAIALRPTAAAHLGVEQRIVIQPVLLADALALRQDLGRMGVLLGGRWPVSSSSGR
jgi:hypothetical protein